MSDLNRRLNDSIKRLGRCINNVADELSFAIEDPGLEVAPEKRWFDEPISGNCPREFDYGPGLFGPGQHGFSPCTEDISSPQCPSRSLYDSFKGFCPSCAAPPPKPGGIVEFMECCAPFMPPEIPFSNPSWDGNCDSEPRKWRACIKDTRNDPPAAHGWVCCRDGQYVSNPSQGLMSDGGAMGAQDDVPDPPTWVSPPQRPRGPRFTPNRPTTTPGGGWPGGWGNPGPITPADFDFEGFCAGKDTGGKLCCRPLPGHPASMWRGHSDFVTCISDAWQQWFLACGGDNQEDGEGGQGGSQG